MRKLEAQTQRKLKQSNENAKMVAQYIKQNNVKQKKAIEASKTPVSHTGENKNYNLNYEDVILDQSETYINTNVQNMAKVNFRHKTVFIGAYNNAEKSYRGIRPGEQITALSMLITL